MTFSAFGLALALLVMTASGSAQAQNNGSCQDVQREARALARAKNSGETYSAQFPGYKNTYAEGTAMNTIREYLAVEIWGKPGTVSDEQVEVWAKTACAMK